jgi:alpha-amylase
MKKIKTTRDNKVFAFYREKEDNRVLIFLNLTKKNVSFKPETKDIDGEYSEYFTGEKLILPGDNMGLEPWGFKVFVK